MDNRGRESFDRSLKNVIDSFERAREWADLSNCLQKVKRLIENNAGLQIPRQRDLAKRLAQCLNPDINVIHQLTLEVYTVVFEREVDLMKIDEKNGIGIYDRKSSIALFFSGLFNFYQFAAFEVKQKFLSLVQDHLLQMKKELILSLPGFILCMLPALEDQNSDILKKVDQILQQTEHIVGTSEFYGEIWKAMLRTPRARLSAIKYMDKRIPVNLKTARDLRDRSMIFISDYTIKIVNRGVSLTKDNEKKSREEQMLARMELHDYFYFYYPNKSKLIMNALTAGLSVSEEQVQVNRGTLDFMISHMPINSSINSIEERIRLVECVTLAYTRKDFATLNKISNWLFGHIDEDDEEIPDGDPTIISIVQSQKNLFKKSMDVQQHSLLNSQTKQSEQTQNLHGQLSAYDKLIVYPILVLLRILSEEQNITIPILKHLSIHLLRFIKFHLVNRNADIKKFRGNIINLLEQISPYFKAVLESLAEMLKKEIDSFDFNHSQAEYIHFESIDLISFAISDLQQLYNRLLSSNDSLGQLVQILSNLLKGMVKLSNDYQNFQLILPSLELIDQILDILYKLDEGATLIKQKNNLNFREGIESFNNLYVMISQRLIQDSQSNLIQEDMQAYKLELDTFSKYTMIMLKIIQFQNVDSQCNEIPKWLDMLIQSSKTPFTNICIVSTQIFCSILKLDDKQKSGGGSVMHVQRLIADPANNSGSFTEKAFKNSQSFKENFFRFLQNSEIKQNNALQIGKNCHAHCKEIIQNLWEILDQDIDTALIVELLREFDLLVPKILSDVVIEDLKNKQNRVQQERAIKKFSTFWRYTSVAYPHYMPFNTEIYNKKYLALHYMIDFLMDPDPTLRLSCRSWLSQNKQYNRILDPLIEEFIKNSNFKETDVVYLPQQSNLIIIDGDFETEYVIQNFGKLRNIILNSQDDIVQYMMYKNCQSHIQLLYLNKFSKYQKIDQTQKQPSEQLSGAFWQIGDNLNVIQEKKSSIKGNDFSAKNLRIDIDPQNQSFQNQGQLKSSRMTEQNMNQSRVERTQIQGINIENFPPMLYLDILVEITLYFIRAEYSIDKISQYGTNQMQSQNNKLAETLTVNASACEFMELILKQLGKQPSISNKIAHIIIKPLIDTFFHVIEKKNYAMQVNIINLLDSILNECNFQGIIIDRHSSPTQQQDSRTKCKAIFINSKLIDSIILGLKSDVSFVRQKFIKFVEMYVPYLRKFTKENEQFKETFKIQIEKLMDCMCQLLKRVDVSFFSSSSKKQGQSLQVIRAETASTKLADFDQIGAGQKRANKNQNAGRRLSFGETQTIPDNLESLYINQETDIILIIGGLQCIIYTCLDIKTDGQYNIEDEPNEEELNEEEQIRLGKIQKNDGKKNSGFLSKMFGGGETGYFVVDMFSEVKKVIYERLKDVFVSCIYCWNHLDLLSQNEYHFTRSGMFAYYQEDSRKVFDKLRRKKKHVALSKTQTLMNQVGAQGNSNDKFDEQNRNDNYYTYDELLQNHMNPIQKRVMQLLRPIAKKNPDQFIEGALTVWMMKSKLGNLDVNRSYLKLIQMLVVSYQVFENEKTNKVDYILPVYQVISSIIKFISKPPLPGANPSPLVNVQRWTKNAPPLSTIQTTSESLLCSFLYSYLVYQPCMYDTFFESRSEERIKEYQRVYNSMIKYFNVFKLTRNPFSINWLIEILNITTIKFSLNDTKMDNRLRKDYQDLFNNILSNCASILTDSFNIQFHELQKYSFVFSPTMYELLWRYEYITFKNTVIETNDGQISKNLHKRPDSLGFKKAKTLVPEEKNENPQDLKFKSYDVSQDSLMNQADMIFQNPLNALKNPKESKIQNGSIFFNKTHLKLMVDKRFEYQHQGGSKAEDQSIFKNMEILLKPRENLQKDYLKQSDFMESLKYAIRNIDTNPKDLLIQSKFFTIITLKQIFVQTLQNLIGSGDTEKTRMSMQIICNAALSILQQDSQPKKGHIIDLKQQIMNEIITDFFSSLIQKQHLIDPQLLKYYKKDILDQFNAENFFQTSMLNLKQWQIIMKCFIDNKPDEFFEEQMVKWNFTGGIFEKQTTIILQRCYAMKRIAFLIFACDDDDFQGQLDQLMKKMIEVFKQQSRTETSNIKQRLFLFFLTRVMLVRLNFTALTEALRKLWPHLLNELISVFEIQANTNQAGQITQGFTLDKENTDLAIEAIKLVELLSSLNIEDFQMNQWIFLIDGYGMKPERSSYGSLNSGDNNIETDNQIQPTSQKLGEAKRKQKTLQGQNTIGDKQDEGTENFKTFIIRFIGNSEYSFYNVETPLDGQDRDKLNNYFSSLEEDGVDVRDIAYQATIGENLDFGDDSDRGSRISIGTEAFANSVTSHNQTKQNRINIQPSSAQNLKEDGQNMFMKKNHSVSSLGTQPQNSAQGEQSPSFIITKTGDFDNRLQEQACSLQLSINDQNLIGNEFNRQEAEFKIETDFLKNDEILKN